MILWIFILSCHKTEILYTVQNKNILLGSLFWCLIFLIFFWEGGINSRCRVQACISRKKK